MVYGTSNGPQDDIGNYLGPCSRPSVPARRVGSGNTPLFFSPACWHPGCGQMSLASTLQSRAAAAVFSGRWPLTCFLGSFPCKVSTEGLKSEVLNADLSSSDVQVFS